MPYIKENKNNKANIAGKFKNISIEINKGIKQLAKESTKQDNIIGKIPTSLEETKNLLSRMGPNFKFPPKVDKNKSLLSDKVDIAHAAETIRAKDQFEKYRSKNHNNRNTFKEERQIQGSIPHFLEEHQDCSIKLILKKKIN